MPGLSGVASQNPALPVLGLRPVLQAMMPVSVAGLSMRTVAPRTPDHTATTDVGPELLSGVTTDSVVGTRPVLGGDASL